MVETLGEISSAITRLNTRNCLVTFESHLKSSLLCMFWFLHSVNDGSGRLPAYRGLVDAVQTIVRSNGIKGLYQVCF